MSPIQIFRSLDLDPIGLFLEGYDLIHDLFASPYHPLSFIPSFSSAQILLLTRQNGKSKPVGN